jgi:hypothetical protein
MQLFLVLSFIASDTSRLILLSICDGYLVGSAQNESYLLGLINGKLVQNMKHGCPSMLLSMCLL